MPVSLLTLKQLVEQENLIFGEEAIKLSGMQNALVDEIAAQNQYFGSMTTFRVSDPDDFPPFNSPGVPKPSSIHSKTSSVVGGYIPMDPIFTRPGVDGKPRGHHHMDNLATQEFVQVKWTLWEILKRCLIKGDFQINWPTDGIGIVRFGFKDGRAPIGFKGFFELDLGQERGRDKFDITEARVVTRSWDDPQKYLNLVPDKIRESFSESGHDIISIPYKIFYNLEQNDRMKPLMVFAKDGKPIIGDWDKDLESMPLCAGIQDLKEANTEFNTLIDTPDDTGAIQQVKLIDATKKLFINLLYKNLIFQDDFNQRFLLGLDKHSKTLKRDINNLFFQIAIKTSLLERAGVITPYEFLTNILTNHVHNCNNADKGLEGYFDDPCQHGVESRSPFKLDKTISHSPNGPRFHIISCQGREIQYVYTVSEEQRVKLYSVCGLLETNFIHVGPWADMEKWHVIIERQIELRQQELIAIETMVVYKQYIKSVQPKFDTNRLSPKLGVGRVERNEQYLRENTYPPATRVPPALSDLEPKRSNTFITRLFKTKTSTSPTRSTATSSGLTTDGLNREDQHVDLLPVLPPMPLVRLSSVVEHVTSDELCTSTSMPLVLPQLLPSSSRTFTSTTRENRESITSLQDGLSVLDIGDGDPSLVPATNQDSKIKSFLRKLKLSS